MPIRISTANPWFVRFSKGSNPTVRLFCFPFAGSSASVFRSWIHQLSEEVEVMAVQLPGRENRLRERCMNDMEEIVENLELQTANYLDLPFVFFGHSLGSLIGYELLRRLESSGRRPAELFFASGGPAPHTCISPPEPLRLTQDQVLLDLQRLSPAHSPFLADREVLALILPMLRADFEIYANYRYRDSAPLNSPIVAIRGAADNYITHESQLEWKRHTTRHFSFHVIPGSHLFIADSPGALLALLNTYLDAILYRHRPQERLPIKNV